MIHYLKLIYPLILALLLNAPIYSQTIFEKALSNGIGYELISTSDGGYAITGSDFSSLLLIKTDSTGNMLWQKHFGDISGLHPEHDGLDLMQMPDGGYIICGRGRPFNSNSFAYFIRTDSMGNQIWDLKLYSDMSPNWDVYYAYKMSFTSDGEIVAAGRFQDDSYILIRIDTAGNLVSRKHVDVVQPNDVELLEDFICTDTAYYFLGASHNPVYSNYTFNITKTDTAGNILFDKNFGANNNSIEIGYSFLLDANENFHVTGIANYLSGTNYFLNVYNITGDTISTNTFPVNLPWQGIYSCDLTMLNNKYYLTGYLSGNTPNEAIILCVDTNGNELFRLKYGGADHDELFSIIVSNDSNLVCVGETNSFGSIQVYLVKVDPAIILSTEYPIIEDRYSISCKDGNIFIKFKNENSSPKNIYLIDFTGKVWKTFSTNHNKVELETGLVKSGIYLLRIESEEFLISRKIYLGNNIGN